jgi:hypothetical protein
MSLETRIVRINGGFYRIPWCELPDPHPDGYGPSHGPRFGETCGATEPDWPACDLGGATCTLPPHAGDDPERGTMHIAHNGESQVIAIWGRTTVTDADFTD